MKQLDVATALLEIEAMLMMARARTLQKDGPGFVHFLRESQEKANALTRKIQEDFSGNSQIFVASDEPVSDPARVQSVEGSQGDGSATPPSSSVTAERMTR